jgi:ribulose-5-phosphate 4-epimerase/fuculose-1-phosphate aldolase
MSSALVFEFDAVREGLRRAGIPITTGWSLSVRDGNDLVITGRCAADRLGLTDLVRTSLAYADGFVDDASADLPLHRVVYGASRHRAVLVCRPPYAMTLAAGQDRLGVRVPVVAARGELDRALAAGAVVIRADAAVFAGHVPGSCLESARALEAACVVALNRS